MSKRIVTTGFQVKLIRDTSKTHPRIEPSVIAAALGAEPTGVKREPALAPITLFAVRAELMGRLHSSGGRPALADTDRRVKIPLADTDWANLEEIAAKMSADGISPSAGQIASVMLKLSIQSAMTELAKQPPVDAPVHLQ